MVVSVDPAGGGQNSAEAFTVFLVSGSRFALVTARIVECAHRFAHRSGARRRVTTSAIISQPFRCCSLRRCCTPWRACGGCCGWHACRRFSSWTGRRSFHHRRRGRNGNQLCLRSGRVHAIVVVAGGSSTETPDAEGSGRRIRHPRVHLERSSVGRWQITHPPPGGKARHSSERLRVLNEQSGQFTTTINSLKAEIRDEWSNIGRTYGMNTGNAQSTASKGFLCKSFGCPGADA